MKQQFAAIIPARYASSRFPGKPLVDINGMSMIMRTYHQALKAKIFSIVVVATDDERIFSHVIKKGGKAVMTKTTHESGTDRACQVTEELLLKNNFSSNDVVVNIQGDEPFIAPAQIVALTTLFTSPEVTIATQAKKIVNQSELFSTNCVKVLLNCHGEAMLFSRNALPFCRDTVKEEWLNKEDYYKHIGIYAYRIHTLQAISKLPIASLEQCEKLEQLRWLYNGFTIHVQQTNYTSFGIDTPEELAEALLKSNTD